MSVKNLIDEIKSEGILRAGHKLEKLYDIAHHNEKLLSERDARIAALEAECDALFAENSSIKVMNDCLSEELRGYESDGAFEGPLMHLLWWKAQTPATDTFLREQRAKGVEMFARHIFKITGKLEIQDQYGADFCRDEAESFAAQLRNGEAV